MSYDYVDYEAFIYDGHLIMAKFRDAEEAIQCLKSISVILNRPLRLETRKRTTCPIPDRISVYGNEFHYRPQ